MSRLGTKAEPERRLRLDRRRRSCLVELEVGVEFIKVGRGFSDAEAEVRQLESCFQQSASQAGGEMPAVYLFAYKVNR